MLKANSNLFHVLATGLLLAVPAIGHAFAHVVLTEPLAPPGARYVGHFKVGHGCGGSPTIGLRIEIPAGVRAVTPQTRPGWTLSTEGDGNTIRAVSWKGGILESGQPGTFTIAMTLPEKETVLLFSTTQSCRSGEEHWSEPPPQTGKAKRPAPTLAVTARTAATASVTVADGWFRALPPSVPSGGYFTLHNAGGKPVALSDVETPACGAVMIHKSGNGGMEHVMSLDVAAGETVTFAPGGYHLMCMAAKLMLKPGGSVPVTLIFSDGQRIMADFQVRNALGK